MHVGDTLPLEDASALGLDLLGTEVVEQATSLAEEHGHDVELELVEETGGEGASCATAAPWTSTCRSPAAVLAEMMAVSMSVR